MADKLFSYVGWPAADGYRWFHGRRTDVECPKSHQALVPAPAAGAPATEKPVELPKADVVLFRVFAETKPSPKAIRAFADCYGWLGVPVPITARKGDATPSTPTRGELLADWQAEICLMGQLVAVWDLWKARNTPRLARHFRWEHGRLIFLSHVVVKERGQHLSALGHMKRREEIPAGELPSGIQGGKEPEAVLSTALAYIRHRLDQQLRRREGRAIPTLAWHSKEPRVLLRFVVSSLISAIWLEFADAVAHDRDYHRCAECSKWFEVAPDAARSHRRFCSDGCRSKAYRQRQDRARRMHFLEGSSFEEIAAALDSSIQTIKRWITGG